MSPMAEPRPAAMPSRTGLKYPAKNGIAIQAGEGKKSKKEERKPIATAPKYP